MIIHVTARFLIIWARTKSFTMNFFRVMTIAAGLAIISLSASAQNDDEVISYRGRGYRGNVAFTDQYLVWMGFDTSHGYMFNEHHYLGAGAGLFWLRYMNCPLSDMYFLIIMLTFRRKKALLWQESRLVIVSV